MGARCMHHVELPAVIKGRAVLTRKATSGPGRYAAVTNLVAMLQSRTQAGRNRQLAGPLSHAGSRSFA